MLLFTQEVLDGLYSNFILTLSTENQTSVLKLHKNVLHSCQFFRDIFNSFGDNCTEMTLPVTNLQIATEIIYSLYGKQLPKYSGRELLQALQFKDLLCLSIDVESLYNLTVPPEDYPLLVEVLTPILDKHSELIIILRYNLPIGYDLSYLPLSLVTLIQTPDEYTIDIGTKFKVINKTLDPKAYERVFNRSSSERFAVSCKGCFTQLTQVVKKGCAEDRILLINPRMNTEMILFGSKAVFSKDGSMLVTYSYRKVNIYSIYSLYNNIPLYESPVCKNHIHGAAISSDNKIAAYIHCVTTPTMNIWNLETGDIVTVNVDVLEIPHFTTDSAHIILSRRELLFSSMYSVCIYDLNGLQVANLQNVYPITEPRITSKAIEFIYKNGTLTVS